MCKTKARYTLKFKLEAVRLVTASWPSRRSRWQHVLARPHGCMAERRIASRRGRFALLLGSCIA
jgi:hypothetical protein